jgi:hypothetical protein
MVFSKEQRLDFSLPPLGKIFSISDQIQDEWWKQ